MINKKIKVALIGLGNQGKKHLESLETLKRHINLEVVGICDVVNSLEMTDFKFFNSYYELYEKTKPDIVIIATPNYLHKQFTIEALKRGINVIKEKPLAVTYRDSQEMVNLAKSTGKILATTQQRYYSPLYLKAKSLIPFLGDALKLHYRFTLNDQINSWRWDLDKAGGGSWLNMGWHGVSIIHWLLGDISKVNLYWRKGGKRKWKYYTDHSSYAKVLINNKVSGSLFLSCAYPKGEVLKIIFSKGVLYLSRKDLHIFSDDSETHITDRSVEKNLYEWQLEHLIQRIMSGKYDMQKDLKIMNVIQKGIDSVSLNTSVDRSIQLRTYN